MGLPRGKSLVELPPYFEESDGNDSGENDNNGSWDIYGITPNHGRTYTRTSDWVKQQSIHGELTEQEAYADPGTPSEPSDSEGGNQGGGAASKWQRPSGANRAGGRAQARDPPTRCRPSRAQRRTKVLSDLKGRNCALEVELQAARGLIAEPDVSTAKPCGDGDRLPHRQPHRDR
jgi:hypothetical protein